MADDRLSIEVMGRCRDFTYQEAGFEEKRRGKVPDRLWGLLNALAIHGGILPPNLLDLPQKVRSNLKQNISQLGKRLSALLLLEEPPFKDSHLTHRYETRFRIAAKEGVRFPTPAGVDWDRVSITETRPGNIAISVDTLEAFTSTEHSRGENGERTHWERAERSSILSREYDLRTLGLMDAGGRLNLAGEALLALLRGNGKIQRQKSDRGMLTLNRRLCDLLQLDHPPFQFSDSRTMWSARFEASSIVPDDVR
jgi:hypothetical protein